MRRAQAIVKQFCAEREIEYYETSFLASYRELLSFLNEIRRPDKTATDCKPDCCDVTEPGRFTVAESEPLPEQQSDRAADLTGPLSSRPIPNAKLDPQVRF